VSRNNTYKNFNIRSTPVQLPDSRRWTLSITIDWERDGQVTARPFSADNTYRTETEADLHGIVYGQRIMDGTVQGFSVD
jgi:hypothetical protein